MVEFRILVDLVVASDTQVEARNSLGSCGVDFGGVSIEDVDREAFPEGLREGLAGTQWDITLENLVDAETPEAVAATFDYEALRYLDPEWHCLIFEGDDEVLELDASDFKEFKCCECGTKYEESFCSTNDVSICRWCSGEEKEAGILE